MRKGHRRFRKNFLALILFVVFLIVVSTVLIFRNAIGMMKKESGMANMNQASIIENNLIKVLEQADRIATSVSIMDEVSLFLEAPYPEKADSKFYITLQSFLKSLTYSTSDRVSSIILYTPKYKRLMSQNEYVGNVSNTQSDNLFELNLSWISELEDLNDEQMITHMKVRAVRESYPYVWTILKQKSIGDGYGVIAVDIDLSKIYDVIFPYNTKNVDAWIIDQMGRVIIHSDKRELYANTDSFKKLEKFEMISNDLVLICEDGADKYVYAQRYNKKYGFYVVVTSTLEEYQKRIWYSRMTAIGSAFVCIIVSCIFIEICAKKINKPIKDILNLLDGPEEYQMNFDQADEEIKEIADRIIVALQLNKVLKTELEKRLEVLQHTQLQALKMQINPHFLFNSLNVIVMLIDAEIENSDAARVIVDLADVLKYALSDEEMVTFAKELDHTKKYVNIMKQRYIDVFQVCYDIQTDIMECMVPKLLMQPLIENAVFHGLLAKENTSSGILSVSASQMITLLGNQEVLTLRIDIKDNGKGMNQELIDKIEVDLKGEKISMNHIGLQNVAKRLDLIFPELNKIEICSKQGYGTCISLYIPLIEK